MTPIDRRTLLAGGAVIGAAGLAAAHAAPAHAGTKAVIGPATGNQLHVMTFNIRLDRSSATQPGDPDHWPERRPILISLLERERPTLLGIQEAQYQQLSAIEEALPHHQLVGFGRKGGSHDEYSAIYFDRRRFELLEWDQFWLSDTPLLIGSATWGNTITRIVTWARLRDRNTGKELGFVNSHFDHQSENARVRSAQAIADLVDGPLAALPVVVTGDFNSPAVTSGAYRTLVDSGVLVDTWTAAARRVTPAWGTFPAYKDPVEGDRRIDWVLTREGIEVKKAAINTYREDGRYPSDHVPVQAVIRL
jgi:endonuclease/exonuclease/phosphatase family metal-dependent hydrolase